MMFAGRTWEILMQKKAPKIANQKHLFHTADSKEPHVYVTHIADIHISQVSTDHKARPPLVSHSIRR